jgi:serine O-acetyltransferase
LLLTIRSYQRWQQSKSLVARLFLKWLVVRHRFWSAVTGADIPLNCQIGGGLLIPHPNGIVIHPDARIGVNCLIFQQVTIGGRAGSRGLPQIGDHVDIGAGAKILGSLSIGHHARIGANAVIVRNVERGAVAIGINPGPGN